MDSLEQIRNYLQQEFDLNEQNTGEMIEEFKLTITDLIKRIHQEAKNNHLSSIHELAHSIKGTSGNVGAIQLAKLGDLLEEAAETNNYSLVLTLTEQIDNNIKHLFETP